MSSLTILFYTKTEMLADSSHLSALAYDWLRRRRVGLRPQHGRRRALVPAVALPEGGLRPAPSHGSDRREVAHRGGGGGEDEGLQGLDLGLQDVDLERRPRDTSYSTASFKASRLLNSENLQPRLHFFKLCATLTSFKMCRVRR